MNNQQKAERATSIANVIIGTAGRIAERAKNFPRYKAPRIARVYRQKQRAAFAMMGLDVMFGSTRIAAIASQPLPKFPLGGLIAERAYIDEGGPEYINLYHFKNF